MVKRGLNIFPPIEYNDVIMEQNWSNRRGMPYIFKKEIFFSPQELKDLQKLKFEDRVTEELTEIEN